MEKLREITELARSIFTILRDLMVFIGIVVVLLWPRFFLSQLRAEGYTELTLPFGKIALPRDKTDQVTGNVEIATKSLAAVNQALADLSKDPALARKLASVSRTASQSEDSLRAADRTLRDAVAQSADASGKSDDIAGWMYLGTVDAGQRGWAGADRTTDLAWPIAPNATGRVDDDAYVRGSSQPHSTGDLIGIARRGTRVRVDRIEVGPSAAGGVRPVWGSVAVQ